MTLTYHYQPAFHNILVWKINNVGPKRMKYPKTTLEIPQACLSKLVRRITYQPIKPLPFYERYQNTRNNILGTFSMSSDTGNSPSSLIWLGFTGSCGLGAAPLSPFSAEEFCGGCGCDGGATGSELFSFKFSLDLKLI